MAKQKKKYYCVWVGHTPGVYSNWSDCQAQTRGYSGAKFKSFGSLGEAEYAYKKGWQESYTSNSGPSKTMIKQRLKDQIHEKYGTEININSICVDAACSGNPGKMEYRGVQTVTGEEIFHSPAFPVGTNNIGEFLAIVHALALYYEKQPELTIYTDSKIAKNWVRQGKAKTKLTHNGKTAHLYEVITRAEKWLKNHTYKNPILKWETREWGEIPADFGRK